MTCNINILLKMCSGEFDHSLHSKRWPKNPWVGAGFLRKVSTESAVAAKVLNTGRLRSHPHADMFLSGMLAQASSPSLIS